MKSSSLQCPDNCTFKTDTSKCEILEVSNTCHYVFYGQKLRFVDAKQYCEAQGLSMVQYSTDIIRKGYNIKQQFSQKASPWIGGKGLPFLGWVFVNETKVMQASYMNIDSCKFFFIFFNLIYWLPLNRRHY